jgi:GNAT superfamily N-acetyltransferase
MTPEPLTEADDATRAALTALCVTSKAHWGYDDAFMAACADVLRVTQDDLKHPVAVVRDGAGFAGMAQVKLNDHEAELARLFVSPDHMSRGVGTALIGWAKAQARNAGVRTLRVESDPDAEAFYLSHGALRIGHAPSEAVPGRMLPLLSLPTGLT